jgi:hypothetical protein
MQDVSNGWYPQCKPLETISGCQFSRVRCTNTKTKKSDSAIGQFTSIPRPQAALAGSSVLVNRRCKTNVGP